MRKLAALAFALIVSSSFVFPKPILASFLSGWFFPTPTPLPNLGLTATPTPKPTIRPTPRPTIKPTPTPSPVPSIVTDNKMGYIMDQINDYRKSLGLAQVKTDPYTCNFATVRVKEISAGFNHDGFNNRVSSKTLPYPSYHFVTENLAETTDYKQVENLWQNSPGHVENMRGDTPYVCVESYGNFYAYEGWKP